MTLALACSPLFARAGDAVAPPRPIRVLAPASPLALPGEKGLQEIIDGYNARRPAGSPAAQLIRRGDHFSALKELMALFLAGDAPDLAAIEASELPALERARLGKPIPKEVAARLGVAPRASSGNAVYSLPFEYSAPVLVADAEAIARAGFAGPQLPATWDKLVRLASSLTASAAATGGTPLALPLQGSSGLWILESLAGHPLWKREAGGLKANRELEDAILALQGTLPPRSTPALVAPELTWERAIQDFLERKSPLLVTTLDALPTIARKASFKWKAGALPSLRAGAKTAVSGADLIVTQSRPEVWRFLEYLYSPPVAGRWSAQGGFIPLNRAWRSAPEWKNSPLPYRDLAQTLSSAPRAARSTDTDVVRAHSEWISALHSLFGETAQRLPVETVFAQLDSALTLR